jgi:hypothetical protein
MTTPYHCKIHAVSRPCASCIELGLEPCNDADTLSAASGPSEAPTTDFEKGYTFPCGHTIGFKETIQADVKGLLGEEAAQAIVALQRIQLDRHANRLCTPVDLLLDFTLSPIIRAKDTRRYSIKGEPAEAMACGHKVHKELSPEVLTDLMACHGQEAVDDAKRVLADERLKHTYGICKAEIPHGHHLVVEVTNGVPKFLLLRGEFVVGELVAEGRLIKSEP